MFSIKNFIYKGSFLFLITLLFLSFKDEKDSLHGRVFNTSMSETRNGVVKRKVIADHIYFKNGKLKSDFIHKKYGYKWIRYRINKDSIYVDFTGSEVRLLVVEASATDETNQTVMMNFTTLEWDIDGEIKITKNDRLRHMYALAGREKGGKPKKMKNKDAEGDGDKSDPLFKIVMP